MTLHRNRRRRRHNQINIVPLVDVLIVLIFFFLITTQFETQKVLNITPPELETAGENRFQKQIQIAVNEAGESYFNNQLVDKDELEALLKVAVEFDPEQKILIIADENAALKHVTSVMDQCRQLQFGDVRLQTR